jgi:hypothetical protein
MESIKLKLKLSDKYFLSTCSKYDTFVLNNEIHGYFKDGYFVCKPTKNPIPLVGVIYKTYLTEGIGSNLIKAIDVDGNSYDIVEYMDSCFYEIDLNDDKMIQTITTPKLKIGDKEYEITVIKDFSKEVEDFLKCYANIYSNSESTYYIVNNFAFKL